MKNGLRRLRSNSWQAGVSGLPAQAGSGDSTLMSRPPTASFSFSHVAGSGQPGSLGPTRRLDVSAAASARLADNLEGIRPAARKGLVATSFTRVLLSIVSPLTAPDTIRLIGLVHYGAAPQAEATRRKRCPPPSSW